MEIKLNRLELQNFKGVKAFSLEPNGRNCTVRGENGTGKTTLSDSAHWLFFGKDSQGRADFSLKTLDADGQELHNLNHSVEAVLEIDGRPLTLKKVFKEKWTKKRGAARAEFTGHTTDFFVDGVPVQEKEWKTRISSIIAEDTFKLLTSPAYFNSLHWGKRREILLQVCGNVADADVIASDKDLADLPKILGDHSLDDQRKIVTAKKREINEQLKEIPARIDELTKSIVDVSSYDSAAITARVKELTEQIQTLKAGSKESVVRKQKAEVQAKLAEAHGALDRLLRDTARILDADIDALDTDHRKAARELQGVLSDILSLAPSIASNERELARLRADFTTVAGQEYSGPGSCPTCGQPLPEDQIKAATERHNLTKAARLEAINEEGKRLRKANDDKREQGTKLETLKTTLEASVKDLAEKLQTARDQKPIALARIGTEEKETIADLKAQITALDEGLAAPVDTTALEAEAEKERTKLAEIKNNRKAEKRIKELADEEKVLAAAYEELERQTFLVDKFIVRKVALLEDRINSKFSLVRWKLFSTLINQGVSECCEATINGVPFSSANTGSQILAGLDIISTLSRHYGIKAPLFLDHRESLTTDPKMDAQMISLVAVVGVKELEVSYQ